MGGIGSSQALFLAGALFLVTFGAAYTWRRRTT